MSPAVSALKLTWIAAEPLLTGAVPRKAPVVLSKNSTEPSVGRCAGGGDGGREGDRLAGQGSRRRGDELGGGRSGGLGREPVVR